MRYVLAILAGVSLVGCVHAGEPGLALPEPSDPLVGLALVDVENVPLGRDAEVAAAARRLLRSIGARSWDPVLHEDGLALVEALEGQVTITDEVLALSDAEWADLKATLEQAGRLPTETTEGQLADLRAREELAPQLLLRGRRALRQARYADAVRTLSVLEDTEAWELAEPFHREAVDALIRQERVRLGGEAEAGRASEAPVRQLAAVRDALAMLVERYPTSRYVIVLERDVERLDRELAARR